jgi:hypothetical protein
MTDMQTSLPLLIVRPSILNPVINFSTHLWPVKWNSYWIYLCLARSIPCSPISINTITNNMIHFISSCDVFVHRSWLHLLFTLALAPSHYSSIPPRGPVLSLWLALHTCNRSVKPSLVLIFSIYSHDFMSCLKCNELLHHIITCGLITCVFHSTKH